MALRALRFALCVGVSASATCLDGGIPFGERKKLENANGESYPIGIWIPDWAASYAANILVATIVEEVFGFHTLEGAGSGTVSGFYAISGCRRPNEIGDLNARGCTDEVSKYHIGMETWTKSYPLVWEQLQTERGSMAARNLGNMGYEGVTGGFIPKPVQQEAYVKEGIALQYFRFWNASWYAPSQYFDPISMINATDMLKPCSSTASIFTEDGTMKSYVELSGDVDGVVIADDGTYSGKCADGYWWMSPSCRHNASLCVPFVTGGVGWDAKQYMQKSAKWNMPVALGVAASWGKYTSYPHTHPKSYFYWWIPDPTFLELQPLQVIYPPHDRIAYSQGDQSSAASAISIDKLVSRDLSILAPNVESFVKNVMVSIEQMNDMLLDQKNTSDTWRNTTCRWLRSHADVWRSWIPDESQCFPGFGLYDTVLETFTDHRVNVSNKISCQACPSGTFSQPLTDSTGDTYICVHCPKGTSQALGAAQLCRPCKSGEYQDEVGSRTCKRCAIGSYQDEQGAEVCKACPETTTTLGLGSVGASDCGCPADHIDVDESGGVQCQACSEGLTCPILSNLADLHRGESDLGDGYVPQVQKGFYSTKLSPTEVYRCRSEAPCPGGAPGTCAGGLVDTPCAQCHEGSTWTGSDCADCAGWRQVLWGMFIVGIFVFLLALYYLTSNKVTAKATVLFATTASVGLLVMSMQNLGLIGMMTIDWPESLKGIFGVCQFLLLDIDSYGFSCIAGSNPTIRYLLSVLIFPVGVLWLTGCFCTSKLLPAKYHWNGSKVCSTIGAFMQMSFSTMSAASLAPMMCYKHPNGLRRVLKYPDVICGSEEHTLMLVIGWCMLCTCVLGFVALCTYAVVRVPHWSVRRRDAFVAAVRFLVFRFRLDAWWFGVPLLVRGPLLSLPVVLATDYPPVQIVSIAMILSSFLVGQMIFWPWKVPMLNLSDCIVSFCVTLLVTTASLHLKIVDGPMIVFAEAVSTSMLSGIFAALGIMVLMTSSALIYRSALGGKQELRIFNLGPVTNSKRLAMKVKAMASKLEVMEMDDLSARLAALAVFDMNKVTTCITLLATEVAPPEEGAVTYKFNPRINSSSFDPSLAKPKRSKRSTMSSNSVAVKDENEANEKQDGNQDVTEATNRQPCEPIESAWM